jgi:hypothetical protein
MVLVLALAPMVLEPMVLALEPMVLVLELEMDHLAADPNKK